MRLSNPATANLVSTITQVIILSLLLLSNIPIINFSALGFFIASGVFASGFGRLFNYISVDRLGVSVSGALVGISPLLTTILAIIFLGEIVSISTILGAIFIVGGVFVISYQGEGFKWSRNLSFPLISAIFYSLSGIVRKIGLNIQPNSLLGAQIGSFAGLLSYIIYLTASRNLDQIKTNKNGLMYFIGSGIVISIAWIAMFNALMIGNVSVVSSIIGGYPLFSLVLSYIALKGTEDFGLNVILGSLIIVIGVVIISLF
jgi:transporter family protein